MAKKVILKDDNVEIMPITRGELVLDSSGQLAFHSSQFLATQSLPGLMSGEDKTKLDSLEKVTVEDKKVEQVNTTTNSSYRILFSNSADDTTKTEGARKSAKLLFNPSTGALTATALIGKLDWSNLNDVPKNFTPAQHIHNTSEITALTSYSKASSASDLVTTDTLNAALGKLEYKADTAYDWIVSVTTADTDKYINKWQEIIDFLNAVDNKEGADIIDEFVTRKTGQTITGVKTFSTLLKFTVALGTAPFTVTSTTKVSNLNSDMVDGYHISTAGTTKPWGTIVTIGSDGVSEMGRYIDFHYDNTTGSDYSTRLLCRGNHSNVVTLPSATGTLALTSQIPSVTNYYWANVKVSATSSTTTTPTFGNTTINGTLTMGNIIITKSGSSQQGIKFGTSYLNLISNLLLWQSPEAIRFGSTNWDWNAWAGLKYNHSSKIIYLGLADGTVFNANSGLSGGKLYLPGISNIYTGNGTNLVWHAGNDGSGSGLDADLLDGKHASAFATSGHTHSYLTSGATLSGDNHAAALKTYFTNNKASIPRNSLNTYYSSAMSNGSLYFGYFLSGYDTTPYGGFFVAHYNEAYYVGILTGSFTLQRILTSTNYSSYLGYIGTTPVQKSAAAQALTGITRISNSASNVLYLGNANNSSWVLTLNICSHSGASKWAINVNGQAWFSKLMVGIVYNGTGSNYAVNVSGDSHVTGWSRAGAGFYVLDTGVHYSINSNATSCGEIALTSNNEFNWGSSNLNLYFNHRAASRGTTVTNYIWNAGSSSSYASHTLGALISRGDLTLYGLTQTCNKANDANHMNSALQIREYNFGGAQSDTWAIAPRLSWHWSGRVQTQIGLNSSGDLKLSSDNFVTSYLLLHLGNSSVGNYSVTIGNTAKNFVRDWGHGAANMNAVARGGRSSMGMANLSTPSGGTATAINPNGGTDWHHFINIAYTDGGAGSNSWITQIANKAGTTDLWVRSRSGGTISDTANWTAGWTRILTGTNYSSVLDGRYYTESEADSRFVNYTGDTMTGALTFSLNNSVANDWTSILNPANAVILKNNLYVNHGTALPMITWANTVNSYGYVTRYSIGSVRSANGAWGILRLCVGNNDAGTSCGCYMDLDGDGSITTNASMYAAHFYENSDILLKLNILEILNADKMPIIKEFDWKESGEHSYGLIAQELEEQGYSELVSTKDDGYKTVNYSAALSLIVGKLQVKIKELEKEIEILKNKN